MSETTKQCNLFDVKNNYILKWIFNNFDRKYMLEIIRYNKSIQNRLDKDIKDYQKVFGKIEIEIMVNSNSLITTKKMNLFIIFILMKIKMKKKRMLLLRLIK
jgi:hypothetical protein